MRVLDGLAEAVRQRRLKATDFDGPGAGKAG